MTREDLRRLIDYNVCDELTPNALNLFEEIRLAVKAGEEVNLYGREREADDIASIKVGKVHIVKSLAPFRFIRRVEAYIQGQWSAMCGLYGD